MANWKLSDKQIMDSIIEMVIRFATEQIPQNHKRRAEIFYTVGKELMYTAAAMTEEPEIESETPPKVENTKGL